MTYALCYEIMKVCWTCRWCGSMVLWNNESVLNLQMMW